MHLPKEIAAPDDFAPLSTEDEETVQLVHQRLIQEVDIKAVERLGADRSLEAVEMATRALVMQVASGLYGERKEQIIRRVVDDAVGLGPLQPLIKDQDISEIMVNAPDEIYFERDGIIYLSALRFRDRDHVMLVIDRIISPLGRRVDESSPFVDARLPDGSRVNIIIPPLIPRSPTITIRKFRPDRFDMNDLVKIEHADAAGRRLPSPVRAVATEHGDRGRNGHGQDDDPERPLGLHPRAGADHYDRGPDRAEIAAASRHRLRGETAEHRGPQ